LDTALSHLCRRNRGDGTAHDSSRVRSVVSGGSDVHDHLLDPA
jgi:hypothetical protein